MGKAYFFAMSLRDFHALIQCREEFAKATASRADPKSWNVIYRQGSFGIKIVDPAYIPLPPCIPPIQFFGDGDGAEEQIFSELISAAIRRADLVLPLQPLGLRGRIARPSRGV